MPAALTVGQALEGSTAGLSSPKGSGAAVLENGFAHPAADLASTSAEPSSSSVLSEMTTSGSIQMDSLGSLAVRLPTPPVSAWVPVDALLIYRSRVYVWHAA